MISASQAKLIQRLNTRKRREEQGAFLVEGARLVEELLASAVAVELVLTAPSLEASPRGRRLLEMIEAGAWIHVMESDARFRSLAATESPQGVLAVARMAPASLSAFDPPKEAAVLVLDRVSDPGNMGTLLRTAHALGVVWVVALPGSADPWNPKTVRATAGSIFWLPVSLEPWEEVVIWLRRYNFAIFGADPAGEVAARSRNVPSRLALVVGSEASGLATEVAADCDSRVAIELRGGVESLNVAVAGALLLDRLLSDCKSR